MTKNITFRVPEETAEKIKEMAELLNYSQVQVLIGAIDMYYNNRELVVEEDNKARIERLKAKSKGLQ